MPTLQTLLDDLKSKGSEKTCVIYARHGMRPDRLYGVSVADMKLIAKSIKGQQSLAYELYDSGIFEAMYLAGMVADGAKMTRDQLASWADGAKGMPMITEHTVPWVTVENLNGQELANEWIRSDQPHIASAGWRSYSGLLAVRADSALDFEEIKGYLKTVIKEIAQTENRVKSAMNGFVIAVGTYVSPLLADAKSAAIQMGVVSVDVGDTACKVPAANEYIAKAETAGKVGQKKKTIRC